jgi:HD-like signal output (HDOD) protein
MSRFWANSVFCGLASRALAQRCHVLDSERLFVEGLLRDLGHLVMHQEIPELAVQARQQSERREMPVHVVERELLGFDFAAVGSELMMAWKLPEAMAAVTQYHLEPERANDFVLETRLVYVASHLTGLHDTGKPVGTWKLAEGITRVWQSLGLTPDQLEPLVSEADAGIGEARDLFVSVAAAA